MPSSQVRSILFTLFFFLWVLQFLQLLLQLQLLSIQQPALLKVFLLNLELYRKGPRVSLVITDGKGKQEGTTRRSLVGDDKPKGVVTTT